MIKIISLLFIMIPSFVIGQTISGFNGTIEDSTQIIISGYSFGENGPTVLLFDNFEDGLSDVDIDTFATVGTWTSVSSVNVPQYHADPTISGNMSAELMEADISNQLTKEFAPVHEYFISFKFMIPDGYHWPQTFAEETYYEVSSWKISWIMDYRDGVQAYPGSDDDYCLPTYPNATPRFSIAGNDNASQTEIGDASDGNWWFSWDEWNRFSCYMKAGNDPVNDNGIIWAQGMSQSFGGQTDTLRTDTPLFDGNDSPTDDDIQQWNTYKIPGWAKGQDADPDDPLARALFDDIYISVGDYARARVELGDSAAYSSCTKLDIFTTTSWGPTDITAISRITQFQSGATAYLFVVDADGNVSDGYAVTIGQEESAEITAPTNLTATKAGS
jgi:hypothetical protein